MIKIRVNDDEAIYKYITGLLHSVTVTEPYFNLNLTLFSQLAEFYNIKRKYLQNVFSYFSAKIELDISCKFAFHANLHKMSNSIFSEKLEKHHIGY